MNQGVAEGAVSAENGTWWTWEDVTSVGITLEVTEMLEYDTLDVEAGGVKCEHKNNMSLFYLSGGG